VPDEVESHLLTIFDIVTGWLKFAETKAAVLVALTGTATSGLGYIISQAYADVPTPLGVGLLATELCLVGSLAVALLSFLPQTELARFLTKSEETPTGDDNLYYFGHLYKYAPRHLAERIALLYAGEQHYDATRHRSHVDLAAQIIANSRITITKFRLFTIASSLLAVAGLVLLVSLIVTALGSFNT